MKHQIIHYFVILCNILLQSKKHPTWDAAVYPAFATFHSDVWHLGTLPAMGYSLQLVMAKVPDAATSPKAPTMPATPAAHSAPTLGKVSPCRWVATNTRSWWKVGEKWEVNQGSGFFTQILIKSLGNSNHLEIQTIIESTWRWWIDSL